MLETNEAEDPALAGLPESMAVEGADALRQRRWRDEAAFFDGFAERHASASLAIDPLTLRRYSRARLQPWLSPEFCIRALGDLRGKHLLDVGCGDGRNVVLFAKLGALVTGIDISSGSLELARRRAEVNGVSDQVTLVCGPVETAQLPESGFDIVWGDGVLHHVLPDLEAVVASLARCARPGGRLLFTEPVNLSPTLRRIRKMIPVVTDHTPDERPLEPGELEIVRRHVPDLKLRHFGMLGRLDPFVLLRYGYNYERAPLSRRALVNGLDLVDYALLSLPLVKNLGGICVMWGHPGKPLELPVGKAVSR